MFIRFIRILIATLWAELVTGFVLYAFDVPGVVRLIDRHIYELLGSCIIAGVMFSGIFEHFSFRAGTGGVDVEADDYDKGIPPARDERDHEPRSDGSGELG